MVLKLDLGSGDKPTLPGWTTVDCSAEYHPDVIADVCVLPFATDSAERIFAAHLCEHISLELLGSALGEWHRVLAPGGVMMLVGPDIDRAVQQREPEFILDAIIRHGEPPLGHEWTTSATVLMYLVRLAGWDCEEVPVQSVRKPEWPNAEPDALWQYALRCR